MTETISGYYITGRKGMNHWHPLIEEALLAIDRYSRVMGGEDAIYMYTERTCVGLLAAAAWRCGWVALEEYQLEKHDANKSRRLGRADLYMASEYTEDSVEAKYKWLHLKNTAPSPAIFDPTLAWALGDAVESKNQDDDSTYSGVAFFPVWCRTTVKTEEQAKQSKEHTEDTLEDLVNAYIHAATQSRAHVVAWSFPATARTMQIEGNDAYWPGVIMLASNLKFEQPERHASSPHWRLVDSK